MSFRWQVSGTSRKTLRSVLFSFDDETGLRADDDGTEAAIVRIGRPHDPQEAYRIAVDLCNGDHNIVGNVAIS